MPDRDDNPLYWPIARLTAAYAARELSPVEVIEELITRIDRFNPVLHTCPYQKPKTRRIWAAICWYCD